jgi:cephalosporin hydroxylase
VKSIEFKYDPAARCIRLSDGELIDIGDPRAFSIISRAWLQSSWDLKYVYNFSWLGRPIIQLPEDIVRIQEVIYQVQPDIIIETGIAHGGSLVFFASLCVAIGKGRVIGIDIDIRAHNRKAIEEHKLSSYISLVEGNSVEDGVVESVGRGIGPRDAVLVVLDSNHQKNHVLAELERYSSLVSVGSYIVVCDGIMKYVAGAPRTHDDWIWNNPLAAIDEFLSTHSEFECVEPVWLFNEGKSTERVSYWPSAYLKRVM